MPLPGMPHPTKATGVVEAARVASHRGAPRCSVRSASILALFFLRCYRCKWCTTVQPNPIESASRAGCKDESTGLAFFRHWTNLDRRTLILHRRTASGALAVISADSSADGRRRAAQLSKQAHLPSLSPPHAPAAARSSSPRGAAAPRASIATVGPWASRTDKGTSTPRTSFKTHAATAPGASRCTQ